MLGANRVIQRVDPTRDVLHNLAERRTVNDLGKGGLGSRREQKIEERAIEDIAMLLTQIVNCQLAGLRLTVGRWDWSRRLWCHPVKWLVYYLIMGLAVDSGYKLHVKGRTFETGNVMGKQRWIL